MREEGAQGQWEKGQILFIFYSLRKQTIPEVHEKLRVMRPST